MTWHNLLGVFIFWYAVPSLTAAHKIEWNIPTRFLFSAMLVLAVWLVTL